MRINNCKIAIESTGDGFGLYIYNEVGEREKIPISIPTDWAIDYLRREDKRRRKQSNGSYSATTQS